MSENIKTIIPSPSNFFAVFVGGRKVDYSPVFGFALSETKEGKTTVQTISPLVDGGPVGLVPATELDNYTGISDKKQVGDDKYWMQIARSDDDEEEGEEEEEEDEDEDPEGTASGSDD